MAEINSPTGTGAGVAVGSKVGVDTGAWVGTDVANTVGCMLGETALGWGVIVIASVGGSLVGFRDASGERLGSAVGDKSGSVCVQAIAIKGMTQIAISMVIFIGIPRSKETWFQCLPTEVKVCAGNGILAALYAGPMVVAS